MSESEFLAMTLEILILTRFLADFARAKDLE